MRALLTWVWVGLAVPAVAVAQAIAPLIGNPIERMEPAQAPRVAPALQEPPPVARTGPGAALTVTLGEVSVQGNTALPSTRFASALAPLRGRAVTLAQVEEARIAVLSTYRQQGFPFAAVDAGLTPRADGGTDLQLRVTEGWIAEVRLDGDIGPAGTQVLRFLNPLTMERPITSSALERALLLASDIPGVTVRAVVRPLAGEPGALQLVAQVARRAVTGYFNLDNRASDLAGPWQGLLGVSLNALTEYGERTEVSVYGAEGWTQDFLQVNQEAFIGSSGLRLRGYIGGGRGRPGSTLAAIGYLGDTRVGGLGLSYPIIRRRPVSLFVTGVVDAFQSEVRTGIDGNSSLASRDEVRAARLGLELQALDGFIPFLPPGVTQAQLRLHQGIDGLGSTENGDPRAARAGSIYDFSKATFDLQRNQPLFDIAEGWTVGLQIVAAGQYSRNILPQVEKFYLGGSRLNRGYYAGQVTGDSAITGSVELQLSSTIELPGDAPWGIGNRLDVQFYAFRDQGKTWENLESDLNARLVSQGGGVRLNLSNSIAFDFEGVRRLTRFPNGTGAAPLDNNGFYFRTLVRF
jgi:hemolysin activation/secretion protein